MRKPKITRGGVIPAPAEMKEREAAKMALSLISEACRHAMAPISNFQVGAVARGLSGTFYLGTNFEFLGEALTFDIHAEQAAVINAWAYGEEGISLLAISHPPCGYCRQFLNELTTSKSLRVVLPDRPIRSLPELLPDAFGPADLGFDCGLMEPEDHHLSLETPSRDKAILSALGAATRSYAPYTRAYSGVAISVDDGEIFAGPYAENAAFNPSLSPLESALVLLRLSGFDYSVIQRVILVERPRGVTSQAASTRVVLSAIAPGVELECHPTKIIPVE